VSNSTRQMRKHFLAASVALAFAATVTHGTAQGVPPNQGGNSGTRVAAARSDVANRAARRQASEDLPLALSPELDSPAANSGRSSSTSALLNVLGALGVVLGLFFLAVWLFRKSLPKRPPMLSSEIFESIGIAPLGMRQHVQLVRLGDRYLLLSVTPHGADTLTEVTDAEEFQRLKGLCYQLRPDSTTEAFRQVFSRLTKDSIRADVTRRA
jgi:flagellar biogenesis protein FliO